MLTLLAACVIADPAAPNGATLTGVVRDSQGRPVARATVFIRTAAPRKGAGVL
jgi:hypothetical protein